MATVWVAREIRHDRRVAIKVLRPELGETLGAERFLREIRVTATLRHPNILTLIDSGEVDGLLYYVMPYVEGESLRGRLEREQQLDVDEAIRITTQVAGALQHAHDHGIIHRDIKPENILLAGRAVAGSPVMVADFGIAQTFDDAAARLTGTGVTIGTAAYMSPEQATGERTLDARTDIYSLGCMLYEMLAGEPPFSGPNPRAILAKQLADPVRPIRRLRDGITVSVDEVLAKALSRVPADRFRTAADFAAALESARRKGGPGPGRALRRPVVGAGALIVVAIAAWAVLGRPGVAPAQPSLRVEHFVMAAGDTANAYLAAALEQEIVDSLVASREVRVFRSTVKDLRSDYVVGATAGRIADSVRLAFVVTRGGSGEAVPIAAVARPVGRLQELSGAAMGSLLTAVGRSHAMGRVNARATDPIAYDLYLRGRYQADRRTEPALGRSVAAFHAAIVRDSGFAEAWAGLARALQYALIFGYTIPGIPKDSMTSLMVEASDRALELDSLRAYVWIARSLALREIEPGSRGNVLAALSRAIAIDSQLPDAWFYVGNAWEDSLVPARALMAYRRAIALDPTHRQTLGFLVNHFIWSRQFDSAAKWADSGKRIDPAHLLIRQSSANAHFLRGELNPAEDDAQAAERLGQGPDLVHGLIILAAVAMKRGKRQAADTLVAQAIAAADTLHPTTHDAVSLAWGYLVTGQRDRAIRILERFEPRRDLHFQLHLQRDPQLDPLRSDRRFVALLTRGVVPR